MKNQEFLSRHRDDIASLIEDIQIVFSVLSEQHAVSNFEVIEYQTLRITSRELCIKLPKGGEIFVRLTDSTDEEAA